MRPGGPLRKTRLERRTPLQLGGPLTRSTPLRAKATRPARLTINLDDLDNIDLDLLVGREIARPIARDRFGGWCEIQSPWCQGRGREFSHRRAAGQGGLWVAENGLWSCGHGNLDGCHGWVHQHPENARENGWIVLSSAEPAAVRTLIHTANYGRAWVLLDRRGGVTLVGVEDAA